MLRICGKKCEPQKKNLEVRSFSGMKWFVEMVQTKATEKVTDDHQAAKSSNSC